MRLAHILRGEGSEFFQVSPSRGEEGGESFGGVLGELVAVGFRDLLHQSVGSELAELASDPLAFLRLVQARLVGQQAFAQVAVAEPVQRDCVSDSAETRKAAADRLQQVGVGLAVRVECMGRATVKRGPLETFSVA